MKQHWADVKDLVGLLADAIKKYDPDGVDYVFLSECQFHNEADTKHIIERLQRQHMHCKTPINAPAALQRIFQRYETSFRTGKPASVRKRPLRRLSTLFSGAVTDGCKPCVFIVLTDARWYPPPDCKVSTPVVWFLKALGEAAKNNQVGISFIRFGESSVGLRRLKFLDNGLHETYGVPDVIDFEAHDGNALKMLLGSIVKWWDHADPPVTDEERASWLDG
jgi:hypothetical protein